MTSQLEWPRMLEKVWEHANDQEVDGPEKIKIKRKIIITKKKSFDHFFLLIFLEFINFLTSLPLKLLFCG